MNEATNAGLFGFPEVVQALFVAAGNKVALAVIALWAAVMFSRWLDKRANVVFADWLADVSGDAKASAWYFGLRFLGICLLVGMLMG